MQNNFHNIDIMLVGRIEYQAANVDAVYLNFRHTCKNDVCVVTYIQTGEKYD